MGGCLPDFVGRSGYPSIAALSINPGIDVMGHNRTHAARQEWSYSITPSARPSRESCTVMPSAFAVFKLTTNWILVACYTGRSAGFSPFKMRPV
jgi:hypothetical protein